MASIAAMPRVKAKLGAMCAVSLTVLALAGCGGGGDPPEPSISGTDAELLIDTLDEVQDNVDVGSCLVAEDKTQVLQAQIDSLPTEVNDEVVDALRRATLSLGELVSDPAQCEGPEEETTTEETTTEETTTEEETTTTVPTVPTTPTTPTVPPSGGGGVSPGDEGL